LRFAFVQVSRLEPVLFGIPNGFQDSNPKRWDALSTKAPLAVTATYEAMGTMLDGTAALKLYESLQIYEPHVRSQRAPVGVRSAAIADSSRRAYRYF
jgi:hypothetical protein